MGQYRQSDTLSPPSYMLLFISIDIVTSSFIASSSAATYLHILESINGEASAEHCDSYYCTPNNRRQWLL